MGNLKNLFFVIILLFNYYVCFSIEKHDNYFIDCNVAHHSLFEVELSKDSQSKNTFHLISHGQPGALYLNGKWLNAKQISTFLNSEFNIQNSGILYLNKYACEFAQGEKGLRDNIYLTNKLEVSNDD